MTDVNPTNPITAASATEHDISARLVSKGADQEDWDTGPPRRQVDSSPSVPALNSLSREEATDCVIRMLNDMIGPSYKMALAYLGVAGELSPDNHGSERKVNMSCKLVALTTKVIQAVEKLKKDAG